MTLKEAVLKAAAFDEKVTTTAMIEYVQNPDDSFLAEPTISYAFPAGARWRDKQLLPLITQLAEELEAAREALRIVSALYCDPVQQVLAKSTCERLDKFMSGLREKHDEKTDNVIKQRDSAGEAK